MLLAKELGPRVKNWSDMVDMYTQFGPITKIGQFHISLFLSATGRGLISPFVILALKLRLALSSFSETNNEGCQPVAIVTRVT